MKALIPVAGIGAKLRPHTYTQTRALVPIAGKPILAHIVDTLIAGGIKEFVFITGYLGSKTELFLKKHYQNSDISISFVRQEPREGIGHALWCAREHLNENEEIVIMLGDTILNLDLKQFLQQEHSVVGTHKVDTPSNFGVVEVNEEGFVKKLVEKPKIPKSNLAMVGIYKIANPLLLKEGITYITNNQVKTHGEYQLTDILTYMIENGEQIKTFHVDNWYDCGKKESLLEANAILLGKPEFKQKLQKRFPGTVIIPPVSFGENCTINNAIIGPNVAVGDNTKINYSIVKNSIIGSYTEVQSTVLNNSIIGSDTTLKGLSQSLNIGDNAEINFYDK
jgi:glucose-1-phosphate thymidylyltransferase